jgi:uncharacterized protein (TIGR02231 family)
MRAIKFFVVLGLILFLANNVYASGDIEAKSRINEVIVYPDSALISRVADLNLTPGDYKIIFPDIMPEIDENSLRVLSSGDIRLFGAKLKREYMEEVPSEKIRQLKEEIQKLEDQIKGLEDIKKLTLDERKFLESIRLFSGDQIPKDLITKTPTPMELDATLKFLDTKLKENYAQVMDCELKIRALNKKIEVLRNELASISGPQKKLKRSIEVDVQVKKAGAFDLDVSYLVKGASWEPIYDARANFEKSEVEMVSYGIVRQATGEDWSDVNIFLSTAKPTIGGKMPYVSPWFLRKYEPRVMKKDAGLMKSMQTEALMLPMPLEEADGGEIEYSTPVEKGIAVVYKLSRKATIKSDGSENKLPISSQIMTANFEYSTYPRSSGFAYLGSRVVNAKGLQLLSGRVNIFLDEDFVGSSKIDNIAPGEEFDLYLGVDENVKVKREQIEKKVDDILIGGISSRTKKTAFEYKTTIENYKSKKIRVIFFEAMPVSEDEQIKVKGLTVSLEPKEKDWQDRKGVWKWELELEPGQKQEITYTFTIEHPRDMIIEGL